MTPELLTVTEAGKLLNLSKASAHRLATRGVIPTINSGYHKGRMVRRAAVLELIDKWAAESTATDTIFTATPQSHTEPRRDRRRKS